MQTYDEMSTTNGRPCVPQESQDYVLHVQVAHHFFVLKHLFNHLVMFTDIFRLHKGEHFCHLGSYIAFKCWVDDVDSGFSFTK